MYKIILPTDFSDNAYNALVYAVNVLKNVECTFYLVNVYTPTIYQPEYLIHSPGQIGLGDVYQQNSQTQLEQTKAKLEKEYPNSKHTIVPHSAFNLLIDEIESMVKNEGADFIFMGTQGATGAKEVFLGSNTVHVLKKVDCPVIAVPANYTFKKPKKILFPTDYEVAYRKMQLKGLIEIAKQHHSELAIIHAMAGYGLNKEQLANKAKLQDLLNDIDTIDHELPDQTVISAINSFVEEHPVDLLVMIQNKHTFFERLFIEPVIKKIGFHITIPFMVIPHWD
jgi:nucleotide-binding universal stress UspA family protein